MRGGAGIAFYVSAIEPGDVGCAYATFEAFLRSKPPPLPGRDLHNNPLKGGWRRSLVTGRGQVGGAITRRTVLL